MLSQSDHTPRPLQKETGDLTGKAQESTSKLQESLGKYTEGITSKLSETGETLAKSTQALKQQVAQLKEKAAAATARKEGEGSPPPEAAARAGRTVEQEEEPPVAKASASASASTAQQREEEVQQPRQERRKGQEAEASSAKASASSSSASEGKCAKQEEGQQSSSSSSSSSSQQEAAGAAAGSGYFQRLFGDKPPQEAVAVWAKDFRVGVKEAWADLFGLNKQETGMKKHIYQQQPQQQGGEAGKEGEGEEAEEGEEAKAKPAGGGELVVVKQQQKTWERLAEQLKDAPIIQEILKAGTKLADTELGRQAGKLRGKLKDRVEDAREVWETSQNPLVYKLSSVWDDLTSETELGIALREIRRADPDFVLEDWVNTLSERFLPMFFQAYLKGDLKALKPFLSEGMYKQMAEEFRLRKGEGLALDPNVLEISNAEIVQAKMHDHQPVLVLGALIQHINCVRDREGKVVEGKEDEVRASFYLLLFVREYNEAEGALEWKVSERYLGFSQPFI
jgi:hypothetical protein